ncbi:hypothetical protein ACIRRA_30630 [Nocardia sp. NPDC101769]|uniref:hypothetical protein n=1 Tax=Nocardia sp. NPDC101769 TaxID=3364333 RepID=UPI0038234E07
MTPTLGSALQHHQIRRLRHDRSSTGIAVTTICPGIVNTAITCDSTYRGGNEQARRAKINAATPPNVQPATSSPPSTAAKPSHRSPPKPT